MCVYVSVGLLLRRHAVTFRSPGGQGHMSAVCSRAGVERPSGLFIHSGCVCVCKSDLACVPGQGLEAVTSQAFILSRWLLESLIMLEQTDHIQTL